MSQTIGQGGFVGGSDTAGRFIGSQQAGQQSIQATATGATGRGGQFGGGQFGNRSSSFNQQGGFNNRQSGSQSRRVVRPRLQIAFDHTPRPVATVQTNLNTGFDRLRTSRTELRNVQVQVGSNREVVLRGRVGSENDKKLAAMLARLEPGVRTVKNELTIEGN
ncbi:MAG: BON domain-containing protein [Planctomycetaceae bacterium]|nr:BON domain-containing protein [Planctomycetaceae bacterium]